GQRRDPAASLDHITRVAAAGEVQQPRPERRIEPQPDRERGIALEQALESLTHHPRLRQGQDMARADEPAVGVRAPAGKLAAVDQGDVPAGSHQEVRAGRPDRPAANDEGGTLARLSAHGGMPMETGSAGSTINVDSALTYADPRTRGRTRPPAIRAEPSNTLPMMLSCRHT